MRTIEYCPALFHPPLALWKETITNCPFFSCGEANIQICIRAADPNMRRRGGTGSTNAPSECARRNASAACPGPRSAGPFSGPNMRQPLGYATLFNEQNDSRYPDFMSAPTRRSCFRQLESSLNKKESRAARFGMEVLMACIFTRQFIAGNAKILL